jgi:hypothetical protein
MQAIIDILISLFAGGDGHTDDTGTGSTGNG